MWRLLDYLLLLEETDDGVGYIYVNSSMNSSASVNATCASHDTSVNLFIRLRECVGLDRPWGDSIMIMIKFARIVLNNCFSCLIRPCSSYTFCFRPSTKYSIKHYTLSMTSKRCFRFPFRRTRHLSVPCMVGIVRCTAQFPVQGILAPAGRPGARSSRPCCA